MLEPLTEEIEKIYSLKSFDSCKSSDQQLQYGIEKLFTVYEMVKDEFIALSIYEGIIHLARMNKQNLVNDYIPLFEEKIDYDFIKS